ncbi:MAG: flavin reductase family protein [Coriobacteriia bacterium]|nr:flavin reductase family protein [Coriobacteriia bacterium]
MQEVFGRDISAIFNPRPLVLIGVCDQDKTCNFTTIVWLTPLSHNPPLLGFSLRKQSKSYKILEEHPLCSLSLFDDEGAQTFAECGLKSGNKIDKTHVLPYRLETINEQAVPIPEAAISLAIVEVYERIDCGDHVLHLCKTHKAYSKEVIEDNKLISTHPLLCIQSKRYTQAHAGFEVE